MPGPFESRPRLLSADKSRAPLEADGGGEGRLRSACALAVRAWLTRRPLDNRRAGSTYDELCERYLEPDDVVVPRAPAPAAVAAVCGEAEFGGQLTTGLTHCVVGGSSA